MDVKGANRKAPPSRPLMNYSNIRLATAFLYRVFINASSADLIGTCTVHENSFAFLHAEFATNIVKYTAALSIMILQMLSPKTLG